MLRGLNPHQPDLACWLPWYSQLVLFSYGHVQKRPGERRVFVNLAGRLVRLQVYDSNR